jgi:hypothetical protein
MSPLFELKGLYYRYFHLRAAALVPPALPAAASGDAETGGTVQDFECCFSCSSGNFSHF